MKGYWKNCESVAHYLQDWQAALQAVKPNFTLLADLSCMITHPQEVSNLHVAAQQLLKKSGLLEAACVSPSDKIASLQITSIQNRSNLAMRTFATWQEAHTYLDGVSASFQQV